MKNRSRSFSLTLAALLLVGGGCIPGQGTPLELPTTPPGASSSGASVEGAVDATVPGVDVGAEVVAEGEADPGQGTPSSGAPEAPAAAAPYYIAYTAEGYANARAEGRPILLYFWASWCPICRAEEPKIKAWVEGSGLPVAGFRVDFDVQDDLKAQFRIPYQHTTVILDASGAESARFTGPVTEVELMAALQAAAR